MQPSPSPELPAPDAASAAHSERCRAHLLQLIEQKGGSIGFAEFMHEALYAPGLGYYAAGATKLGPAGDFTTSPEISPLFGRVLAAQCTEVLQQRGHDHLLELGAGSGSLAVALLGKLAELDCLPAHYDILEVSADLRERQQRRLQQEVPDAASRVRWLDRLPAGFRGVVIGNEVLDALPVERFRRDDALLELRVTADDGAFAWHEAPASPRLRTAVEAIEDRRGATFSRPYTSEYSPGLAPFVEDVVGAVESGLILFFDYGTTTADYYAPARNGGWLRCHFRHHAHDDPLILPGIQDITAWVDFSAAAGAAHAAGADIAGYVTQAHFLLAGGIADELAAGSTDGRRQVELANQVKMLTLPGEMGERFKCLGLSRGGAPAPPALTRMDRTHTL